MCFVAEKIFTLKIEADKFDDVGYADVALYRFCLHRHKCRHFKKSFFSVNFDHELLTHNKCVCVFKQEIELNIDLRKKQPSIFYSTRQKRFFICQKIFSLRLFIDMLEDVCR